MNDNQISEVTNAIHLLLEAARAAEEWGWDEDKIRDKFMTAVNTLSNLEVRYACPCVGEIALWNGSVDLCTITVESV